MNPAGFRLVEGSLMRHWQLPCFSGSPLLAQSNLLRKDWRHWPMAITTWRLPALARLSASTSVIQEDHMSLSDLAAIGGAVSAVAVLVSLVFLNIQVRQSEKNQRALIQQGRAGRTADIAMRIMDSDFAEVYYRCMNGDSGISETQLGQFMGYCRALFLGAEDSFIQHKASLLNDLAFASFTTSLRAIFVWPGVRAMWAVTRDWYEPKFAVFMDDIAKDAVSHPRVDQLAQWKARVSAEIGCHKAA
jgi:hypothetical protein